MKITYRKFTIDIPGRQNKTTTLTSSFFIEKVLDKLIDFLLESGQNSFFF